MRDRGPIMELESTYKARIKERQELYMKHGRTILNSLPGSELACKELMFMVIQFLCARYPCLFSFDKETLLFSNEILGTHGTIDAVEPLRFLLENVPEDFMVAQKDPLSGLYVLRARLSCSAIGWSMKTKLGRPMHEIHEPVPDYEARLGTSVNSSLKNWHTKSRFKGDLGRLKLDSRCSCNDPDYLTHKRHNPDLNINDIHLRVDWQTLRRLPKAIIFNFKALFTPVTQFREEPYIPQLVAKVLQDSKLPFKEYKGWAHLEHKLLTALQMWAMEQVSDGVVPEGWEERTLDEHPFYLGWKGRYN